jgi:hypothetical protein
MSGPEIWFTALKGCDGLCLFGLRRWCSTAVACFFFWIWVELSFAFALLWFGFVLVLADVKFWQGMVAVRFPPLGRANASGSVLVCKS